MNYAQMLVAVLLLGSISMAKDSRAETAAPHSTSPQPSPPGREPSSSEPSPPAPLPNPLVPRLGEGSLSSTGDTVVLTPATYHTIHGKDNGQPVSTSIDQLDEHGKTNDWYKYLQLQARTAGTPYIGTQQFYLTGDGAAARVESLCVKVNYLGPLPSLQLWTWYIHNWSTNSWDLIGSNASSDGWDGWSILSFTPTGSSHDYVRADGLIELGTQSNNAADDADIDYEAVIVTLAGQPALHSRPKGRQERQVKCLAVLTKKRSV